MLILNTHRQQWGEVVRFCRGLCNLSVSVCFGNDPVEFGLSALRYLKRKRFNFDKIYFYTVSVFIFVVTLDMHYENWQTQIPL